MLQSFARFVQNTCMLHAILSNKAGRNIDSKEVHWRELFTTSEDSLTSTIIGGLLHLPVELFWQILNNACLGHLTTGLASRIISVDFWPHWTAENSENTNFVEPDVFIRTSDFDLIIEAKRFDYSQQSFAQWKNEFQGYINEYEDRPRRIILLAIGGLTDYLSEQQIEIAGAHMSIVKCKWSSILSEVKSSVDRLENAKGVLNNIDASIIILNDIIRGFDLHGYVAGTWLEDWNFKPYLEINHNFF